MALPGVVSQDDLTASWANLPAVIGVALAFWLTWWAPRRWDPPLGRARIVIMVVLVVCFPILVTALLDTSPKLDPSKVRIELESPSEDEPAPVEFK